MQESPFRSFRETQLPPQFQKPYTFARDAHQIKQSVRFPACAPYLYHPVAMAEAAIKAGLDDSAVVAALVHDVVECTPVTFDHIYNLFDAEVHDIVFDLSCPASLYELPTQDALEAYAHHLTLAKPTAKAIKLLDLGQTVMHLGLDNPVACAQFVERYQPLLWALGAGSDQDRALAALHLKAEYAFKWGSRRAYEKQVAAGILAEA